MEHQLAPQRHAAVGQQFKVFGSATEKISVLYRGKVDFPNILFYVTVRRVRRDCSMYVGWLARPEEMQKATPARPDSLIFSCQHHYYTLPNTSTHFDFVSYIMPPSTRAPAGKVDRLAALREARERGGRLGQWKVSVAAVGCGLHRADSCARSRHVALSDT